MNRLACRHDPVARLEARLRYRPCRGSFEGSIRLDPIETHHLRSLGIENSVYRRGSGSTPGKGCQLRRVGRVCGKAASARARDQGAKRRRWTCGWSASRVIGPYRPEPPRGWCSCFSPTSGALAGCSGLDREHPSRGGRFTRRGRPLRGNDHENSTPDRVPQSSPFQGHRERHPGSGRPLGGHSRPDHKLSRDR